MHTSRSLLKGNASIRFITFFLLLICALPAHAERLWGDEGKLLFAYNDYAIAHAPVSLEDGGHSILIWNPIREVNIENGPFLEVISNAEGEIVDTFRYPVETCYDSVISWLPQSQGNTYIVESHGEGSSCMLICLNGDRQLFWQRWLNDGRQNDFLKMWLFGDWLVLLSYNEESILTLDLYDADTGNLDETFSLLAFETPFIMQRLLNQSTCLIGAFYQSHRFHSWTLSADGDTASLGHVDDIGGQTTRAVMLDQYFVREYVDYHDHEHAYELYSLEGNLLSNYPIDYNTANCIALHNNSGFILRRFTNELVYIAIQGDSLVYSTTIAPPAWIYDVTLLQNNAVVVRTFRNYYCYNLNGDLVWQSFSPEESNIVQGVEGTYLFAYSKEEDRRFTYAVNNGELVCDQQRYLGLRLSESYVRTRSVHPGMDGNAWLTWHSSSPGIVMACQVDQDGNRVVQGDPYSLTGYGDGFPDGEGGLWLLGDSLQHLDENSVTLFPSPQPMPLGENPSWHKIIGAVFDCQEGPYPVILLRNSQGRCEITFIDDRGHAAGETLEFTLPGYSFVDYGIEHQFHCSMENDDLLLTYQHPVTMNICSIWKVNRETRELTSIINEWPGYVVEIHESGDELKALYVNDNRLSELRFDRDEGALLSSHLLVDSVAVMWNYIWDGDYSMEFIESVDVKALYEDQYLTLAYRHESDTEIRVARFTENGQMVQGPSTLVEPFDDWIEKIYPAPDGGVWLASHRVVFLMDSILTIAEGYEQGRLIAESVPYLYFDDLPVQYLPANSMSDGELMSFWNVRGDFRMLRMQRFCASVSPVLEHESLILPKTARIEAAWPNPFNSELRVRFALPEAGPVRINVYNIQGQRVAQLDGGVKQRGEMNWHPSPNLASGLYFLRLEGEQPATCKVLYQK